jgi:hypothetical protein
VVKLRDMKYGQSYFILQKQKLQFLQYRVDAVSAVPGRVTATSR